MRDAVFLSGFKQLCILSPLLCSPVYMKFLITTGKNKFDWLKTEQRYPSIEISWIDLIIDDVIRRIYHRIDWKQERSTGTYWHVWTRRLVEIRTYAASCNTYIEKTVRHLTNNIVKHNVVYDKNLKVLNSIAGSCPNNGLLLKTCGAARNNSWTYLLGLSDIQSSSTIDFSVTGWPWSVSDLRLII